MPHTKQQDREPYKEVVNKLTHIQFKTKGDLEYLIYCCLAIYKESRETNYVNLHDAVYAAHHAGDEFKRRYLDVREDRAANQNGEAFYGDKQ